MEEDLRLAENIATKLCHDLSSPIGAINNGMELFDLDPNDEKAMEIVQENAIVLLAQIRLYRLMLGKIDEMGEINLEKLRVIWKDYFHHSKINFKIKMGDDDYVTLTGASAKIISLAIVIAEQIGFVGGDIDLTLGKHEGEKYVRIDVRSKRIIINESTESFLVKGVIEQQNSNNIFLFLLFKLARLKNAEISFSYGGENASINIAFRKSDG